MFRYIWQLITYFNSRIRFKIIVPFALLTVMVAITGVYLSTRLVAGSLEERFTNQLIEAASTVADGLAQRERAHLSELNAIAFTEGIDQAILANDQATLQTLVFPLVATNQIDRVDVINLEGQQLLAIHRPPGRNEIEDYTMSSGADLADWPVVQKVLNGVVDERGDKYVTLANMDDDSLFITIGPVRQGDEIVGAVLISSYIRDLLQSLSQASFADVTLYDLEGKVLDTTLASLGEEVEQVPSIGPAARTMVTMEGTRSLRRSISLSGREYDLMFGIFRARGEPLGFFSVGLPTTFIVSYGLIARNQMALIFATALLLVFGIGYLMSSAITGQLQHLMENAMAVASGDFTRRTQISSGDEIGLLARSLDDMTMSLAGYTRALQNRIEELTALYESSTAVTVKSGLNLDHVLQAVTHSLKEVIRDTNQVVVYLLDESGQVLKPMAAVPTGTSAFPNLAFEEKGMILALLAEAKPQVIPLVELIASSLGGYIHMDGATDVLIAPLIAGHETIGMLILAPTPIYQRAELLDEDTERLLGTLANQSAIAIKNAQLFEATQRAYEELRKLDELKTQFINIAAHELRTPLGAMMGYASFVEKRAPEKLHKPVRFLVASTLRMRTLVDDMLTIQRLDAGTAFLRLASVDIRDIVTKVIADFQPMAELEGHVLRANLPDELAPVQIDVEKITLVLSNLISNAIKFTPDEGDIEVTVQDYIQGVLVTVQDNGPGITTEDQERIFERFYQARAEHIAGHGGMGLGLTIVKTLVELHEGQVWVESKVGHGSTFFFTLPRLAPGVAPSASRAIAEPWLETEKQVSLGLA